MLKKTKLSLQRKFYFGTPDQKKGNNAYYKRSFEEALFHYQEGLKKLKVFAEQPKASSYQFMDAYAFVLIDIIWTHCANNEYKDAEFLINSGEKLWETIEEHLEPLRHSLNALEKYRKLEYTLQTDAEKINAFHTLMINICDRLSDTLMFSVSEVADAEKKVRLDHALIWMKRGLTLAEEFGKPFPIKMHLGLLFIWEKQFELTKEQSHLMCIQTHMSTYKLLEQSTRAEDKLELYTYQMASNPEMDAESKIDITIKGDKLIEVIDVKKYKFLIDSFKLLTATTNTPPVLEIGEEQLTYNIPGTNKRQCMEKDYLAGSLNTTKINNNNLIIENNQSNDNSNRLKSCLKSKESTVLKNNVSFKGDIKTVHEFPKINFFEPAKSYYQGNDKPSRFINAMTKGVTWSTEPKFMANLLCIISRFFILKSTYDEWTTFRDNYGISINRSNRIGYVLLKLANNISPEQRVVIDYLKRLENSGLLKMSINPCSLDALELQKLLHTKSAYVLYNNSVYYVGDNFLPKKLTLLEDNPAKLAELSALFASTYKIVTQDQLNIVTSLTGHTHPGMPEETQNAWNIKREELQQHGYLNRTILIKAFADMFDDIKGINTCNIDKLTDALFNYTLDNIKSKKVLDLIPSMEEACLQRLRSYYEGNQIASFKP